MNDSHYIGQELGIFEHARNWKTYWSSEIRSFLTGDVLEVGAGLGVNTEFAKFDGVSSWVCLEPDPTLAGRIRDRIAGQVTLVNCRVQIGSTKTLVATPQFHAILYIDVLEHISDDHDELNRASRLLHSCGRIIVLAPAHQWLFTSFDQAIGHFRRYNRATLSECKPRDCILEKLVYLDSAGMLASIGNLLFLRQSMPTMSQILFWDRVLVPSSKLLDPLTLHLIGKTVLAVWRKC